MNAKIKEKIYIISFNEKKIDKIFHTYVLKSDSVLNVKKDAKTLFEKQFPKKKIKDFQIKVRKSNL